MLLLQLSVWGVFIVLRDLPLHLLLAHLLLRPSPLLTYGVRCTLLLPTTPAAAPPDNGYVSERGPEMKGSGGCLHLRLNPAPSVRLCSF